MFHRLYVFLIGLIILAAGGPLCAATVEIEPNDIYIFAENIESWDEAGGRVFFGQGNVTVLYGPFRVQSDSIVAWYDDAASRRQRAHVIHICADGNVRSKKPEGVTTSLSAYFTVASRGRLIFNDRDGKIPLLRVPVSAPVVDKARQMKKIGVPTGRIASRPAGKPKIVALIAPLLKARAKKEEAIKLEPITVKANAPLKKIPATKEAPSGLFDGVHTIAPQDWTRVEIFAIDERGWDEKVLSETDTKRVSLLTGGVDIFYRSAKMGNVEIIADRIVIWFEKVPTKDGKTRMDITDTYCEGNVRLYLENKQITCDRMFYDFRRQRALMPESVMQTYQRKRGIPIYYHARMMKRLAPDLFAADNTRITTCNFGKPHTYIHSDRLEIRKTTYTQTYYDILTDTVKVWSETGDDAVVLNNAFKAEIYGKDIPLWYWPELRIGLDRTHTALRRIRLSHSSRNGFSVLTEWNLYDMGIPENNWSELRLLGDLYTSRGAGGGIRFKYNRIDQTGSYRGEALAYLMHDTGSDSTDYEPTDKQSDRGRIKWVHRHRLAPRWWWLENTTLDAELSYISDSGFLNEFYEDEAKEEKEQETYVYLKRQEELWALTFLARGRLNDYQLQTERLPEAAFFVPGYAVWDNLMTFSTTTEAAYLRLKTPSVNPLGRPYQNEDDNGRFYTLNQVRLPFTWGPFDLDTMAGLGTVLYGSDNDTNGGGDLSRAVGLIGFRAATRLWRIYDVYNKLFDVNRLRHIVVPDVEFINIFGAGNRPNSFTMYDDVDSTYNFSRFIFGLKQRLQTKRGLLAGGKRRTLDWMTLDLEIPVYPNAKRDNNYDTLGNLEWYYRWIISDTTQIFSRGEANFNEDRIDLASLGLAVDFSPRLSGFAASRYIHTLDSHVFTLSADYKISERWQVQLLEQFDFGKDAGLEHRVSFRRKLHEWYVTVEFEVDDSRSETSVALLFTPVGMENFKIKM